MIFIISCNISSAGTSFFPQDRKLIISPTMPGEIYHKISSINCVICKTSSNSFPCIVSHVKSGKLIFSSKTSCQAD